MIRRMAQILGNVRVKTKLSIKPLCHKYFPQLAFAWTKWTIEALEQGVKFIINKDQNNVPDMKTLQNQWCCFGLYHCFEHFSDLTLLFQLLTLNK